MKLPSKTARQIIGEESILVDGVDAEAVDHYSSLNEAKDGYEPSCTNRCIISEAGLSRLLSMVENNDWAVITAYRDKFTLEQNILRNRELRASLNAMKAGVYQLVGHGKECQLKGTDGKPVPYDQCPKEHLKDVIERAYLCVRYDSEIDRETFIEKIAGLMTIQGETQDAVVLHLAGERPFGVDASRHRVATSGDIWSLQHNGTRTKIGDGATLGKIAQFYSQFVKKMNVPFVFEGVEIPGSNMGRMLFKRAGLPRLFQSGKEWHIGV